MRVVCARRAVHVNRHYLLQFLFHIADDVRLFRSRVFTRGADCKSVPINPDYAIKFVEQRFCKKSGATISVDQQLLIRRNQIDDQSRKALATSSFVWENTRGSEPARRA